MTINREFRGESYIDFPTEYCIIDIETTGFSPIDNEIIEIGTIKYANGERIEQFQTLVQPSTEIDAFITNLTGITNDMLVFAPKPDKAVRDFSDFIKDSVIVGYNVTFDVNFLYDSYVKHLGHPLTNNFIDVLRLSRRLCSELGYYDLDSVLQYFNLKIDSRHRAISDCIATELVYKKLREEALKSYDTLENFSKTFKVYKPKPVTITSTDILDEWKKRLYNCKTIYKASKFLAGLKRAELIELANYLGILHRYANKHEIVLKIVYSTVGKKNEK